jgi:serine/threonine protein kinase
MKAITALDHPNILPLYDFSEETINATTLTYMVMPFRSEGSLINWLNQHSSTGILPLQEVVYIVQEAASALQHAHNHHLIHLDVKPSNFLIRHREDRPQMPDVLLTDFWYLKIQHGHSHCQSKYSWDPYLYGPRTMGRATCSCH